MDIIKTFGFSKRNNQYTDQAMHWKTKQFWFNFWPKHTGSGATQLPIQWRKYENDQVLPPSAEVKNVWCYSLFSPYFPSDVHRNIFTFTISV